MEEFCQICLKSLGITIKTEEPEAVSQLKELLALDRFRCHFQETVKTCESCTLSPPKVKEEPELIIEAEDFVPKAKRTRRFFKNSSEYECDFCGVAFTRSKNLALHIQIIHLKTHSRTHHGAECDQCGSLVMDLERHKLRLHPVAVTCRMCGLKAQHETELRKHMRAAHNEPKLLACRCCEKIFGSKSQLAEHVEKIHSKVQLAKFSNGLVIYKG